MRLNFKKVAIPVSWVFLGVVLTLSGIYFTHLYYSQPSQGEQEIRRYVLEYTAKEQAALGINCRDAGTIVRSVLKERFDPVFARRTHGEEWSQLVSSETKQKLEDASRINLRCRMLFHSGKNGQLNGLENIGFLEEIFEDFTKFKIPLMFGAPAYCDNPVCRDTSFSEIRKVYEKLLSRLAKEQ